MVAFIPILLLLALTAILIVKGARVRPHKHFKQQDFYRVRGRVGDPMAEVEEACDKLNIPAPHRPYDR